MADKNLIKKIEERYKKLKNIQCSISFEKYIEHRKKIDALMKKFDYSFSNYLRDLILRKNLSEVEVYKKANLDRRIFSKIRNEKKYMPSKRTILAIAIAMELNLQETKNLLEFAGYSLSSGIKEDVIINYFIENKIFDLFLINDTLEYYNFKTI